MNLIKKFFNNLQKKGFKKTIGMVRYYLFASKSKRESKKHKPTKYFFVDKNRKKYTGEEAKKKIRSKNDLSYYSPESGIDRCDKKRWEEAQHYEKLIWMKELNNADNDNNFYHRDNLDKYKYLENMKFENAIELGCGPFTNIVHISKETEINNVDLLDPLITNYLNHKNCNYDNNYLYQKGLLGNKIPAKLHHTPIEEFRSEKKYNLIVIINVLEHCYNADLIFSKILELSKKDTILVFGDKLYNKKNILDNLKKKYDAGHPLKIDESEIKSFLEKNFNPIMYKYFHTKNTKNGMDTSYDSYYYIGKRK